ncbi:MAG: YncE family protein [Opitutaceae bacterium]|nr:YncE family protein [Opitutaceae bacterium]
MKLKLALVAALTWASLSAAPFYQLESALTIKSDSVPNWDYLAVDPIRPSLYIARRDDGILVYNTDTKQVTGVLENTKGGNAITIVPELDRIYVTNLDGSLTVFRHSDLKYLTRNSYGESADNAFYEPVTKQLLITEGDQKKAVFVDAVSLAVTGTLEYDAEKLEGTAADGKGFMYMAVRDRDKVLKIDARRHQVVAEWPTTGFTLPNGVAYDAANDRIFVSTRGNNPSVLVFDVATGGIVASPAIGRNNDVIVFDPEARKIYTANGLDGTLVIINQVDANRYQLAEAATTRPWARTMAVDLKTKKVYLVTAEGTVDTAKSWKASIAPFYPNKYFKDTFTLLTYSSR